MASDKDGQTSGYWIPAFAGMTREQHETLPLNSIDFSMLRRLAPPLRGVRDDKRRCASKSLLVTPGEQRETRGRGARYATTDTEQSRLHWALDSLLTSTTLVWKRGPILSKRRALS